MDGPYLGSATRANGEVTLANWKPVPRWEHIGEQVMGEHSPIIEVKVIAPRNKQALRVMRGYRYVNELCITSHSSMS